MLLKKIPAAAAAARSSAGARFAPGATMMRSRGISSSSLSCNEFRKTTPQPPQPPNHPGRRQYYHGSPSLSRICGSAVQQQQPPQRHNRRRFAVVEPNAINAATTTTLQNNTTTISKRWHGGPAVDHDHANCVHVTFVDADGKPIAADTDAYVGESLLQVAQRNDIELEGACEGVCACSTCHVIFPDWETFESLEEASEDEEDMLDMAFGLTETSRLGCQILITKEMDGLTVEVPKATRNFYVDGHVPQPH